VTYDRDGEVVKRFGFHNLGRHSLATFLMDEQENPAVVQAIMCHAKMDMTPYYSHSRRKAKRAAQEKVLQHLILAEVREPCGSRARPTAISLPGPHARRISFVAAGHAEWFDIGRCRDGAIAVPLDGRRAGSPLRILGTANWPSAGAPETHALRLPPAVVPLI